MTELQQTARLFKTLSDENRVQIAQLLARRGEMCACQLLELLHIGQSTLSHHMKILCDGGIVSARKEGKWMHYSLQASGLQKLLHCLKQLSAPVPKKACAACKK